MKTLRLSKRWSQEQLAQLSGLNVRTIQRVEKGESVGLETLKSLAAVFEISTDELVQAIGTDQSAPQTDNAAPPNEQKLRDSALKQVKSVKWFYAFSALLLANFVFLMLPNYNGGENLGALIVVFISHCVLIAGLACYVFQPFGEKWENEKVAKIVSQQDRK